MQFYYGDKNLHRLLDEIEFWKRQEAEHTVVIRQIVPELENEYKKLLQQFEHVLQQTEGKAVKYIEAVIRSKGYLSPAMQHDIMRFTAFAVCQSQQFIMLLDRILSDSRAVKGNNVAMVVIKHIRRESEYFMGIVQTALYSLGICPQCISALER